MNSRNKKQGVIIIGGASDLGQIHEIIKDSGREVLILDDLPDKLEQSFSLRISESLSRITHVNTKISRGKGLKPKQWDKSSRKSYHSIY